MFTLRTHPFGVYFGDGSHCFFRDCKRDRILSILKGGIRQRVLFKKVFSTAQGLKIKNSAIGQNYFVF
jgi:hypothetical protein